MGFRGGPGGVDRRFSGGWGGFGSVAEGWTGVGGGAGADVSTGGGPSEGRGSSCDRSWTRGRRLLASGARDGDDRDALSKDRASFGGAGGRFTGGLGTDRAGGGGIDPGGPVERRIRGASSKKVGVSSSSQFCQSSIGSSHSSSQSQGWGWRGGGSAAAGGRGRSAGGEVRDGAELGSALDRRRGGSLGVSPRT